MSMIETEEQVYSIKNCFYELMNNIGSRSSIRSDRKDDQCALYYSTTLFIQPGYIHDATLSVGNCGSPTT